MSTKYTTGMKVHLLREGYEIVDVVEGMGEHLGKVRTISRTYRDFYELEEDRLKLCWFDNDIDHEKTEKLAYMLTKGL